MFARLLTLLLLAPVLVHAAPFTQDDARKISKIIRDEGPKGVKAQIQGEELRVSSKKKDDLQDVMGLLKGKEFDLALQFVNYR